MTDIFNINVRSFLRTAIGFQSAFEAFEYGPFSDELNHSFPHYNISEGHIQSRGEPDDFCFFNNHYGSKR